MNDPSSLIALFERTVDAIEKFSKEHGLTEDQELELAKSAFRLVGLDNAAGSADPLNGYMGTDQTSSALHKDG